MKVTQFGLIEGAAAATPPSGVVTIYAKTDNLLYWKDDTGLEQVFGSGGVGTVTSVTSANGRATVATQTTTPVITIVSAPTADTADTALDTTSGTYTPTLTNVTNIAASTSNNANYMRVGNMVTVAGQCLIDPTTTDVEAELGISLPIASNFATGGECGGVGFFFGAFGRGGTIIGDATNNRARFEFTPDVNTNTGATYTF